MKDVLVMLAVWLFIAAMLMGFTVDAIVVGGYLLLESRDLLRIASIGLAFLQNCLTPRS